MIYWICKYLVYSMVVILYRHKTYGKEHYPSGGAMVASNHSSFLDPPLVGISCPGKIHFLARNTLFDYKPLGWLLPKLNTHPVHRGKGNLSTLKTAMELVKSGEKVVIFPEGKRSSNGALHEGQMGVGMLVQRTECQIVPVYVHGTFEIWNNQRKFPGLFGKTACIFGRPIAYISSDQKNKKEAQAAIVNGIMDKIAELKAWYLAGAKGTPP